MEKKKKEGRKNEREELFTRRVYFGMMGLRFREVGRWGVMSVFDVHGRRVSVATGREASASGVC